MQYDLRQFITWIIDEFEPSVRLDKTAGSYTDNPSDRNVRLYGVADMACVLHTIGALDLNEKRRREWAKHCHTFQADDGTYPAQPRNHGVLHNTAFMLGAMNLLDVKPRKPLKFAQDYNSYEKLDAWLNTLDWEFGVYSGSHDGAGLASALALVPGTVPHRWFEWYFDLCDTFFDPHNGMMGHNKPADGDTDQIGGTFHYAFIYDYFRRPTPYPKQRIDAILGLQQDNGLWDDRNRWWMTLDAMYMLTRGVRQCHHRVDDVCAAVHRVMANCCEFISDTDRCEQMYMNFMGPHHLTATISIFAEAQQFLGSTDVVTDWPLQLVLDRRPFI